MESKDQSNENSPLRRGLPFFIGLFLISIGIVVLLDRVFQTGWLPLVILPAAGIICLVEGTHLKKQAFIIPGALLLGVGLGGVAALSKISDFSVFDRIGFLIIAVGAAFLLIFILSIILKFQTAWWSIVPSGLLLGTGFVFVFTTLRLVDFVLFVTTGLGISLLTWGVGSRLLGLIIPGSLLTSIGPGIFFAWGTNFGVNPLSKTGIMIAIFAIGWVLIILFSRVVTTGLVWWPLIPGGIFAVVGWGLYIGGDPQTAPSFIANTGSIGLIIFGLYLLLLRKSIKK